MTGNYHMQRNRSDLETILEKKEEDIAMSMSNAHLQKLDGEESYSFSLRNFHRNSIVNRSNTKGELHES